MARNYRELQPEVENVQLTIAGFVVDVTHFDANWDLISEYLTASGAELEKALDLIKIEVERENGE